MNNKIGLFIFAVFLGVFLNSCSSNESNERNSTQVETVNTDTESTENISKNALHYKIKDASDHQIGEIMINGQNIEIKVGNTHYKSKVKGVKRKYQSREEGIIAEVKYKGEESFKLRTPEADLKWKIKFYDDKFKVSDNEENLNPYQVKFKEETRSKIYLDGEELGSVKLYEDGKIKVKGSGVEYKIKSSQMHAAFGVLLIEATDIDKIIIIAELLAKGK